MEEPIGGERIQDWRSGVSNPSANQGFSLRISAKYHLYINLQWSYDVYKCQVQMYYLVFKCLIDLDPINIFLKEKKKRQLTWSDSDRDTSLSEVRGPLAFERNIKLKKKRK